MSVDDWKKVLDIAQLALIAFTLIASIAAWRVGSVISRRDDAAKLKLEAIVLEGKNKLAAQEERAAIAEKQLKETGNVAGTANQKAGEANERAAHLELDAAKMRERAVTAERELFELRQKVAQRGFTDAERKTLVEFLKPRPKGQIQIQYLTAALESKVFAETIADVLTAAGWTVTLANWVPFNDLKSGLRIMIHNADRVPERALVLQEAFDLVGVNAPAIATSNEISDNDAVNNSVVLMVWPKDSR